MRIAICVDMEGVAGIFVWQQVTGGDPQYMTEGRRLLTQEINAAVRGARKAGATEIVVMDLHGAGNGYSFKSVLLEEADDGAEYFLGGPWMRYTRPFDDGCDAALFVGAHAMAGTQDGVLSHTMSSQTWYNAYINDVKVGESGLCAAILGHWNVPVAFVSGDQATCDEVQKLLGSEVTTAVVKWGHGRFSARNLTPHMARDLIERKVAESLAPEHLKRLKGFNPKPATLKVELASVDQANQYRGRTGIQIVEERTVLLHGDDFWQAWDQFWPS